MVDEAAVLTRETRVVRMLDREFVLEEPSRGKARALMIRLGEIQKAQTAAEQSGNMAEQAAVLDACDALVWSFNDALAAFGKEHGDEVASSDMMDAFLAVQELLSVPLVMKTRASQARIAAALKRGNGLAK